MNFIDQVSIVIVTYKTNRETLINCIKSISEKIKIVIVDNSNDETLIDDLKNFNNIKIILSNKNNGYGAGNNLGLKNTNTKFVIISNPDIVYNHDFFDVLNNYISSNLDFSILGVSYVDDDYPTYGYFDENKKNQNMYINDFKKVDFVTGCSMVLNTNKIGNKIFFDENIFLFYDETDLCRQVKNENGIIYSSKKLKVNHVGYKKNLFKDNKSEIDKLRNWHLMWSSFYYYKKHYGYFYSLKKNLGNLIRSLSKMIFYKITFNEEQNNRYKSRLFGLINSIRGKKSWYRIN